MKEGKSHTAVNLESVKNAIIAVVGIVDPLDIPTSRPSSLYGIEASLVKQAACFVTMFLTPNYANMKVIYDGLLIIDLAEKE